jgi:hypothetical protein
VPLPRWNPLRSGTLWTGVFGSIFTAIGGAAVLITGRAEDATPWGVLAIITTFIQRWCQRRAEVDSNLEVKHEVRRLREWWEEQGAESEGGAEGEGRYESERGAEGAGRYESPMGFTPSPVRRERGVEQPAMSDADLRRALALIAERLGPSGGGEEERAMSPPRWMPPSPRPRRSERER